ncbi:MAG: hypothetical protein ACXVAX_07550 [Pseudobdellovibrio sp.]
MIPSEVEKIKAKKKLVYLIAGSVLALVIITTIGMFVLSKVKAPAQSTAVGAQEQYAGQAETSQQLQTECQSSALKISKSENLQQAVDEYKKHVENCREVYFTVEEKTRFRNEGMFPDLGADLLTLLNAENKTAAMDFLAYLKSLTPWQFYMGPIVCDSQNVLAAYEESIKSTQEKICVKNEDFNKIIFSELKNKNFSIIEKTMLPGTVAWLGSPEADDGCPEKVANIIKGAKHASEGPIQIKDAESVDETKETSVVFRDKSDEDKLVLVFDEINGCIQLKSALISGLEN